MSRNAVPDSPTRRIFFDANVVIAGSMSRKGASRALMMLAAAGVIRMVLSRQVLDEVERNLRNKLPHALPVMAEMLSHIAPEVVDNPPPEASAHWHEHIEAKNAPILEAAVLAGVDYLVTLNSRDFTPQIATLSGLPIVSPAEFMERIREIITTGLR